MGQRRIKDPLNCPFCESEVNGVSSAWGASPEGWENMRVRHLKEHCEHCPTCGQPVKDVTPSIDSGTWDSEVPWVLD